MDEREFTYKKAGVDIEAGAKAVELMKAAVKSTFRPEVLTEIGGFGGLFAFDGEKYKEPVLVSAADGVGTKLKIAQLMDRHEMVGIDLVAMCADDVVVAGAEPLFFLDYIAIGKVVPEKVAKIVGGIAEGCRMAGCALIGGEVAEHPGVMPPDEYDLAGFAVGVVERAKIIDGSSIGEGDVVLGLASSGLHSNGYSLVRKLIDKFKLSLSDKPAGLVRSLGEELLIPTKVYTKSILKLLGRHEVHGLAHITGGGLIENIPRILPRNADAAIDLSSWSPPPIFEFLRKLGDVKILEMLRTFNMGIGMVIVLPAGEAEEAQLLLEESGEEAMVIGKIESGRGEARFV